MEKETYFQTLDLITFLMCSVDLNRGTISAMTHIKMIFSFSPDTTKHFIGNVLCSCDDSVTELINILYLFMINNIFLQTPRRKNLESNLENEGTKE